MKKKHKGSVISEFIVVTAFFSLVAYFALVGGDEEAVVPSVVDALHDRQDVFVDRILAP